MRRNDAQSPKFDLQGEWISHDSRSPNEGALAELAAVVKSRCTCWEYSCDLFSLKTCSGDSTFKKLGGV